MKLFLASGNAHKAAELQARFDRQAGAAQLDAYVASLRARAKIAINQAKPEPK